MTKLSHKLFVAIIFALFISLAVFSSNPFDGKKADLDKLYAGLKDPSRAEESFEELILYGYEAVAYLLKALPSEGDPIVKTHMLLLIGGLGCKDCGQDLMPYLDDSNWRVRIYTIDALDEVGHFNDIGHEATADILRRIIMSDEKTQVKIRAIMVFGDYGNEDDIIFLEALTNNKEFASESRNKVVGLSVKKIKSRKSNM
jgi:HEAT repeat protein